MDAAIQADEMAGPPEAAMIESPWRVFWRRLRRQRVAMIGGVILVALYAVTLFAPFIAPYSYDHPDKNSFFHRPTALRFQGGHLAVQQYEAGSGAYQFSAVKGKAAKLHFFVRGDKYRLFGFIPTNVHLFGTSEANSPVYLFGADQFGRDIFSRLLYGAEISLSIGLIGICISFVFGVILGGLAGYYAGTFDEGMMRFCELIMSIPGLYLIMALRSVFPTDMRSSEVYLVIIVIYSFIRWAATARVIRGMVLSLRERQYVLAARTLGQSNWRILVRHILPGTFSYVIVAATLSVPYYILGEVTLSFLGVGIQEPEASWGNMLTEAQDPQNLTSFPWLLAPGAAIFITVLAFNFLGDGLRDAVDTKS